MQDARNAASGSRRTRSGSEGRHRQAGRWAGCAIRGRMGRAQALTPTFRTPDTGAFSALARAKPDAALEVLLAVCIEEPQHETYSRASMPETGLNHWNDAEPPL